MKEAFSSRCLRSYQDPIDSKSQGGVGQDIFNSASGVPNSVLANRFDSTL